MTDSVCQRIAGMHARLDVDGDGRLTPAELANAPGRMQVTPWRSPSVAAAGIGLVRLGLGRRRFGAADPALGGYQLGIAMDIFRGRGRYRDSLEPPAAIAP